MRTCIACRHEGAKGDLLRFVAAPDGALVPDITGRLPGRGAYTCADPGCIETALRRSLFNRALRGDFKLTAGDLVDAVSRLVMQRLQGLLAMANRAGMVITGSDAVERALGAGLAGGIVWAATDAAPERFQKFAYLAGRAGCTIQRGRTSAELGALLGKEQRTFLLLKPSGITMKLGNELQRFRKFIDGGTQEP